MTNLSPFLNHFFSQRRVIFRCNPRNVIISDIGLCELVRKRILLLSVGRNSDLREVFVQHTLKSEIADSIGQTVNELALNRRVRHQSCALGNPINTLLKLYRLRDMIRANHVEHTCSRLYNVRTASAGIRNRIMYARLIAHMLAKELHADIHQLHCIERTASALPHGKRFR